MQPLLDKFKKMSIIILNVLIIAVCSYFIFQSERFQEKISPKKYWQNKIKTLESELKKDCVKIKFLKLDLEKEDALSSYYKEQAKLKAEEINENIDDIFIKIKNEHLNKMNQIKQEIDNLTKQEKDLKKDLEIAYYQVKILN